jgi:molecular chaperone HscB
MYETKGDDPFVCFGLEPHFDVNIEDLDRAYFKGQKEYHPDRYMNKTKEQKKDAQRISSVLNLAYAELKDPILRAKILLKYLNPENPWIEDETYMDEEILMQMMIVRETLASAATPGEAARIAMDMHNQMNIETTNMSKAFASKDAQNLRRAITRALYVRKVLNEAQRLSRRPFMQQDQEPICAN